MTSEPPLPPELVTYFAAREAARAEAVNAFLASLTERERRLMTEAAVMAYVHGCQHPQGAEHPKDSAVLAGVIDACLAMPDLYPTIAGTTEPDTTDPGDEDDQQ